MQEPQILDSLQREHGGKRIRDVHMTLEDLERQSTLVYVPGYLFNYTYGEVQDDSVEITKQHHQALVPAAGTSNPTQLVRHYVQVPADVPKKLRENKDIEQLLFC